MMQLVNNFFSHNLRLKSQVISNKIKIGQFLCKRRFSERSLNNYQPAMMIPWAIKCFGKTWAFQWYYIYPLKTETDFQCWKQNLLDWACTPYVHSVWDTLRIGTYSVRTQHSYLVKAIQSPEMKEYEEETTIVKLKKKKSSYMWRPALFWKEKTNCVHPMLIQQTWEIVDLCGEISLVFSIQVIPAWKLKNFF